jgi:hypothetical protein
LECPPLKDFSSFLLEMTYRVPPVSEVKHKKYCFYFNCPQSCLLFKVFVIFEANARELMKLQNYKTPLILTTLLFLLVLLFVLPIEIPYKIRTAAKVVPAREWILRRSTEGSILVSLHNHRSGMVEKYTAAQIERGDAIRFAFDSRLKSEDRIAKGDTIGSIQSNEVKRQLARLKGELIQARASLNLYRSGEKEPIIEEADRQVALAKERTSLQKKIAQRQEQLYKNDLISQEDSEIAGNLARIYELETEIAEAELKTAKTGAKPEQVDFIQAQIQSLEDEIKVLQERQQQFTLLSPIDGRINRILSNDTLLIVSDTASVLIMPLKLQYFPEVEVGSAVELSANNGAPPIRGQISRIDRNATVLNGEQVLSAVATLDESKTDLPSNIIVSCSIMTQKLTPGEYILRFIKSIFRQ